MSCILFSRYADIEVLNRISTHSSSPNPDNCLRVGRYETSRIFQTIELAVGDSHLISFEHGMNRP